jgi:tetratricopeptide (TPR) repeat protein
VVSALLCQGPGWTEGTARPGLEVQDTHSVPGPPAFREEPAEISYSIRQEILLEYMPAQQAVEVLEYRFPNLKFFLHPTMNGFYITGTKRDTLDLKSAVGPLDELYRPGKAVTLWRQYKPVRGPTRSWPVAIGLQHLSPTRVARLLESLYSEGSFTADENRQEIVVDASDSTLYAIREMLKVVDKAHEPVAMQEEASAWSRLPAEIVPALSGKFGEVDSLLKSGQVELALQCAQKWQSQNPGDVLAFIALGQCYKANGQPQQAARAYSSLVELYPERADLMSFAGCLLGTVWGHRQSELECLSKAVKLQPEQPKGHLLKAYAQVRVGLLEDALQTLEKAYKTDFASHRSDELRNVIGEDLGMVAAALIAKEPSQKSRLMAKLKSLKLAIPSGPRVRCLLTWESEKGRMEFQISDAQKVSIYRWAERNSHLNYYRIDSKGYGPECVAVTGSESYHLAVREVRRVAADYVLGNVAIVRYDGAGGLGIEHRPFVMMNEYATVDLGKLP